MPDRHDGSLDGPFGFFEEHPTTGLDQSKEDRARAGRGPGRLG